MSSDKAPVIIKKYANRRLYNTGTSAYVTLEDLACMVKRGDDFVVYDAKSGDDITRAVLGQIIFDQESKGGQSLLPITFLRQLIRFYGDSMQMLVPSYLEFSLANLVKDKGGMKDQVSAAFANGPLASAAMPMFAQMEEQARQNMAMFRQALTMFAPFGVAGVAPSATADPSPPPVAATPPAPEPPPTAPEQAPAPQGGSGEFDDMRRQLEEMQRRIEFLANRG